MNYKCPVCGASISNWLIKKEHIECPDCRSPLTSNSKKVFKQSFIVALAVWFLVLLIVQHYSGSWGYAVLVSIEAGGILAAMLAALYYRIGVRIKKAS